MISALILTKNEEANLSACLDALDWCDDVVVFDSFSEDSTVSIAESRGARVFQRLFDNYGLQREAARQVDYRYDWVIAVDADEIVTNELRDEILDVVANNSDGDPVAYRVRRKDHFMGKWIRHCTLYPSWFLRLYRHESIRYPNRPVHEYPEVDGPIGQLDEHLLHFSFNKGLEEWLHKHVRYAGLEAQANIAAQYAPKPRLSECLSFDPIRRRRGLKMFSIYLPFRPLWRFLYMYVFRKGMLDGKAGFTYCMLLAIYEYFIVLRLQEIRRRDNGLKL